MKNKPAPVETERNTKTEFLTIRLEPKMRRDLATVAAQNERTIAGELRHALRRYLDEQRSATA